jgi:amino acid adenylation domain-containing protein
VTDYRTLAAAVRECAEEVRAAGLAPGEVLAVSVSDGLPAVVALLAALRTGVPFVWLDPASPSAHRNSVTQDCRPAALLRWRDGPLLCRLHTQTVPVPGDTACVVYTSGSTGAPKGIVQRRANLDQFTPWFAAALGLTPGARMLQWARMTYDAAYAEILAAVHVGSTLIVPAARQKSDPNRIAAITAQQLVTHLLTVPSLCRALFTARAGAPLPEVGALGLSGEALPPDLLRDARRLVPNAAVTNFYGPTECTLATWFPVPAGFAAEVVPIGRPIPGREIRLDPAGEILVRTRYLAHGYLRRDRETAHRFLPDPDGEPGVRLYRTGDLGGVTPDGDLVFVGRLDDQVKIRGVRVRLGEIEAALRTAPDVADAAVRVVDVGQVASRIAAYVCGPAGRQPDVLALRRHMTKILSPVLVPAHYVVLAELPRTITGKVDRGALPEPAASPAPRGAPPRGEWEQAVARIWRDTIGCPEVGVDDDFFDVGGYSLLAPDVVAAVHDRLSLHVPMRSVFEYSRLGDFAAHLTTLPRQTSLAKEST